MKDGSFKNASKMIPLVGWVASYLLFSPTLSNKNGQWGLECSSLFCRWISVNTEGKSTGYDPEAPGSYNIIVLGVLVAILNIATYVQVSVR